MSTWNASKEAYSDCEHCNGSGFTRDWEDKKTRCIVCLLTRIEELESAIRDHLAIERGTYTHITPSVSHHELAKLIGE